MIREKWRKLKSNFKDNEHVWSSIDDFSLCEVERSWDACG